MTTQKPHWTLAGEYFESCNCEILCPCLLLGARPTEGHCDVERDFGIGRIRKPRQHSLARAAVTGNIVHIALQQRMEEERAGPTVRRFLKLVCPREIGGCFRPES